jgi:preprotein translocase subunit SecA
MLNWLFKGKKVEAARGEDCVWMSHGARLKGLDHEVEVLAEADRSVLLVALSLAALDELETALARHQPSRCADVFGKEVLRERLSKPGSVTVALSGALGTEVKAPAADCVDILVYGRNDTRAADDAILAFADALGPNAHIVFHLSLDDPLLKALTASLGPLLEKLGMKEDEPISHAMVTRAIRNAQDKRGG